MEAPRGGSRHPYMATLPEETIRQVRESVDIVDLIGKHVSLRRAGRTHKGLCPFHDEKSPSFFVDPNRRSYKCFGCSEWGDAIDFVQKIEGKGFVEAIRGLAAAAGIRLPEQSSDDLRRARDQQAERDLAYRITSHAAEFYRDLLKTAPEGAAGRSYQAQRNIGEELAERFRLGYAPDPSEAGWDSLARELTRAKLPLEVAESLGLVLKSDRNDRYFDRFRGRLIFPVVQPGGSIIAFSGRILPQFAELPGEPKAAKYLNSPESMLYRKSDTLYGIDAASKDMRRAGRAVLVEGNVDVVTLHRLGVHETVAPLGTALTANQCRILKRFVHAVVLCFDGDPAGTKAAREATALLLDAELEPRLVALPSGEDPDSANPEHLQNRLAAPQPALTWLVKQMVSDGATESIDAQARAVRDLIPLLRKVKGRDAREEYTLQAANLLKVPARRIWAGLQRKAPKAPPLSHPSVPDSAPMPAALPLPHGQAVLTSLVVDRPELADAAKRSGVLKHVTDPRLLPILSTVIDAALAGDVQPGSGALLELVEEPSRKYVFGRIFAGHYADTDNPQAIINEGIGLCHREALEREIAELDTQSAHARETGDFEQVRALQLQRLEIRKRQARLQSAPGSF
ncbi:MAG: DNA primase [Nannocystaceae bacterium]